MKTTVYLVRHGQTEWNKQKKMQGKKDIPLSEEGIRQAELLAKRLESLRVTKIVSSKLERALTTAKKVAEKYNLPVESFSELNERDYGNDEGRLIEDLKKEIYGKNLFFHTYTSQSGETPEAFKSRVIGGFEKIAENGKGEKILIVCHGAVLHVLVRHLRKIPHSEDTNYRFLNTSLSIFHITDNKVAEEMFNDTSHLII